MFRGRDGNLCAFVMKNSDILLIEEEEVRDFLATSMPSSVMERLTLSPIILIVTHNTHLQQLTSPS